MRLLKLFFTALMILVLFVDAKAGVNIKNGNFYISYTDHDLTAFNGFDITRTYNSHATGKGLFGYGWGSEFETRLYIIGDGNLLVIEYGAGTWNTFSMAEQNEALLTQCINQLVKAAVKNEDIQNNPVEVNRFRRNMRNSLSDRLKKWVRYSQKDLVQSPTLPEGTRWQSMDLGYNELVKTKTGFKRTKDDGSFDLFNTKGNLVGHYTAEGKLVYSINYNEKGQITQLKDKGNNLFFFTFTKEGFVQSVRSRQGTSLYWYKGNALIKTKDIANNVYRHEYDSAYNMIAIYYTDRSPMFIEYENTTLFCKKITEPNGRVTEYVYNSFYDEKGNVDNNHYATWVFSTEKLGSKTDSSYFEYEIKDKADGSSYQYRYVYRKNNDLFEEINNESCELPDTTRRNNKTIIYRYNNNCITVAKETDSLIVKAEIDTLWNKASKIIYFNKLTQTNSTKLFSYNQAGNPVQINEDGKITSISYTSAQKIASIKNKEKELIYSYNSFHQLQSVTLTGTGELLFVYNKTGELLRTESKKGKEVAAAIETCYQEMEKYIQETSIQFDF